MKKLVINENWEQELIEDLDQVLALAYKQTPNMGYVLKYGGNEEELKAYFVEVINSLEEINAEANTKVYLLLLPNTSQVKVLLDLATYNGTNATSANKEATDSLLIYPDCEVLEYWQGEVLTEAKKKKKRKKKKTPKVTYLTGFPWLNDHRFNHAMGSCGCNKNPGEDAAGDINDAIGGGESVGDAGSAEGDFGGDMGSSGGEGGGMGESLVNEAMTPLDKMRALEAGTRGFNAAAASDQKLWDNRRICTVNGLYKALKIIEAELINRGLLSSASAFSNTKSAQASKSNIKLGVMDFHSVDLLYLKDHYKQPKLIVDSIINLLYGDAAIKALIVSLIFALTANYIEVADAIKSQLLTQISKQDLKQIIVDCKTDSKIIDRITDIYNSVMHPENTNEGVSKMNNLTEAKRYIKRYYIRPQNIFCSNKAEILNALVKEVGENNCSVYSLKALADHDDVHLLQPKDIIYYYDDGILYDKNHVKVMDYDLNVKHEEERKKFGNVDAISDETFEAEYEDRLTESLEDFYVDFDDINAYGIKLTEGKEAEYTCCICGEEFEGYGNNPAPVKESGKCCDACNRKFVIPARLSNLDIEIDD